FYSPQLNFQLMGSFPISILISNTSNDIIRNFNNIIINLDKYGSVENDYIDSLCLLLKDVNFEMTD
ncbi:MAG: hypothetical protein ACXWFC_11635, partial [Nitrososphaeraceae archaeon]